MNNEGKMSMKVNRLGVIGSVCETLPERHGARPSTRVFRRILNYMPKKYALIEDMVRFRRNLRRRRWCRPRQRNVILLPNIIPKPRLIRLDRAETAEQQMEINTRFRADRRCAGAFRYPYWNRPGRPTSFPAMSADPPRMTSRGIAAGTDSSRFRPVHPG